MRLLFLYKLNILFVFFNKSGSTVYGQWLHNLLTFLELPYEFKTTTEIDYIEFITNVSKKNPKVYFFVRNPLERMITSFYWVYTFDIQSLDNKFPIKEFFEFADKIKNDIETTDDMHLLPQTWELVKINNYLNERENSMFEFQNFRYDKRFFKGCEITIIQIEKFGRNFDALMQLSFTQRHTSDYKTLESLSNHHYFKNSFGLLKEIFETTNQFEKMFSIILFNFVKTNVELQPHHNNLYKGLLERLLKNKEGVESLNKINDIIANESKWLGYDNSLILNMNRFL